MEDVIQILLNDSDLIALLGGAHIYPNYTDEQNKTAIVYTYNTYAYNKCTRRIRLKTNIIASSLEKAEAIEKKLCELLCTFGDEQLTDNIMQCEVNGGGDLYDATRFTHHRILYFDLIMRC